MRVGTNLSGVIMELNAVLLTYIFVDVIFPISRLSYGQIQNIRNEIKRT
jgi:hypothetical protein